MRGASGEFTILVNGAEPAGGICVRETDLQHGDGSPRSAYVEFYASGGASDPVPCRVIFNRARTVPDRPNLVDPVEWSPRAWHAAPTLFALTDADYLCASEIAPLPLVPLTDPRLPPALLPYLTDVVDKWNRTTEAGAAQYDEQYVLICRYLVSGDPHYLAEACMRNQSDDTTRQAVPWSYYVVDKDLNWSPVDANPTNYEKIGSSGDGLASEPYDTSLTQTMLHGLTGWFYAKICVVRNASVWFSDALTAGTPNLTGYTPRLENRRYLQQAVLASLLGLDYTFNASGGRTFKSPTDEWGTAHITMPERVRQRITQQKAYAETLVAGVNGIPAWWPSLWATGEDTVNGDAGYTPNFQYLTSAVLLIAAWNEIDVRPELLEQLDAVAAWLRSQLRDAGLAINGHRIYAAPYSVTDPAAIEASGAQNGYYTCTFAWTFAYQWARDGDESARDLYDHVCDERHLMYSLSGEQAPQRKLLGEVDVFVYHGAAMRCGVLPYREAA